MYFCYIVTCSNYFTACKFSIPICIHTLCCLPFLYSSLFYDPLMFCCYVALLLPLFSFIFFNSLWPLYFSHVFRCLSFAFFLFLVNLLWFSLFASKFTIIYSFIDTNGSLSAPFSLLIFFNIIPKCFFDVQIGEKTASNHPRTRFQTIFYPQLRSIYIYVYRLYHE